MANINVRTNFPEVARELKKLENEVADKALRSTVNKSAAQGRTAMTRAITSEYNLKSAEVRSKLRVIRASRKGRDIKARLDGTGRLTFNIIRFVEGRVSLAQARRRARSGTLSQVHVKIRKTGGVKPLKGAFIANRGRTVFKRVPGTTMRSRQRYAGTKHAEQIAALSTIGIPRMFNARKINIPVVKKINDNFVRIFEGDVKFFTEKFNRGR